MFINTLEFWNVYKYICIELQISSSLSLSFLSVISLNPVWHVSPNEYFCEGGI